MYVTLNKAARMLDYGMGVVLVREHVHGEFGSYQVRAFRVNHPRHKAQYAVADKSETTLATTLPPRSTAPTTGVFLVPRPRLLGSFDFPSLVLRGLPPTYAFVSFHNATQNRGTLCPCHFRAYALLHEPRRFLVKLKVTRQLVA